VVQLEFIDDFPEDKEEELRKLLRPILRIVSRDLSKLIFKISSEPAGEAMIQVKRRYHVASVWLGHVFFSKSKEEQKEILIHELTHVLVDMLSREITFVLDAYFDDGSAERNLIEMRLEESEEKLTDAVALAFYDILKELEEARETLA